MRYIVLAYSSWKRRMRIRTYGVVRGVMQNIRLLDSGISCLQPLCPESLFNPLSQNPSPSSLSSKHTFRNPLPKSPSPESQPAAPVMAMPHLQSTVCPFLPLLPSPPRSGSAPSPDEPAGAPSPPGIFFSHETLCPANPVFGRY